MCLTYIVIKCFGSNHNKCHTKGKYSSYNVIATNFLHFDNKIHQNVVYTQYRPWNNNRLSDIDQRWCSFISRNLFTIEHNNRGWIIGKGNVWNFLLSKYFKKLSVKLFLYLNWAFQASRFWYEIDSQKLYKKCARCNIISSLAFFLDILSKC